MDILRIFHCILHLLVLSMLVHSQETCLFGDSNDDCYFPCRCEPSLSVLNQSQTTCNSTTGQCFSGQCSPGFVNPLVLKNTGSAYSCQPNQDTGLNNNQLGAALYLVDPVTKQRLTPDISARQSELYRLSEFKCG